jgi:ferrous iron transport protein A
VFHVQDTVQVGEAEEADGESGAHSVILYFGLLEGVPREVGIKRGGKRGSGLDNDFGLPHTETKMQLSGNSAQQETLAATLVDLKRGDAGILDGIDLPGDDARRLMELGFLPGTRVTAGLSAPGGDPRVFQVDGSEIALRRETAKRLRIRVDAGRKPRRS